MSFAVICPSCGKSLNAREDWLGKRLKCPDCATTFPAIRTPGSVAAIPAATNTSSASTSPRSSRAAATDSPASASSNIGLPFTLGPDDRYPRLLYWGLLLYLVFDAIFAVPTFLTILREKPDVHYHGERLIGWAMAIVIPPGVLVCIVIGISLVALIYAVYQLLFLGIVLTSALGSSMVGESLEQRSVVLQSIWHAVGIILGVWYFFARRE